MGFLPLAFIYIIVPYRIYSSVVSTEQEKLIEKVRNLDLEKVVSEAHIYISHLNNGSVANDRNFILDPLDPSIRSVPGSTFMGPGLSSMVSLLQMGKVAYEVENSVFGAATCTFCKAGFMFLKFYLDGGKSIHEVITDARTMCRGIVAVSYRVCKGLVDLFSPEILTVVKLSKQTPEEMCGFMFSEACSNPALSVHEWRMMIPPVIKPRIVHRTDMFSKERSLKILHVTDTHFDHLYKEGSNAACDDPMCCREESGFVTSDEDKAGYWGDFRKCDTPLRTIEAMYAHIVSTHPSIDMIYWTGDLPAHDIWKQSKGGNVDIVKATARQLIKYFPNVPIYPALGNHESVPVDSFPPPSVSENDISMSWLHDALAEEWGEWLGENHKWSVKHGAYYSKTVSPGLRVISINMNYCMNKNIWLLLNSTDPADQLRWLIFELQLAEFKGEKVHILGHVPPGHVDCVKIWSRNFYEIINRYSDTIVAQFYGHTHTDEFQLFYSTDRVPLNVAYIAPSITPYYGLNPSYRIYDVSHSGEVLDHQTWILDLEEANNNPREELPWYMLYSAKSAYSMINLSADAWQTVVERLQVDAEFFEMFYAHYYSGSRRRPPCDPTCRHRLVCNLVSGKSHSQDETCREVNVKGKKLNEILMEEFAHYFKHYYE